MVEVGNRINLQPTDGYHDTNEVGDEESPNSVHDIDTNDEVDHIDSTVEEDNRDQFMI